VQRKPHLMMLSLKGNQKERSKELSTNRYRRTMYRLHMHWSHSLTAHREPKNNSLSTTHSLKTISFNCLPSLLPTQNSFPFGLYIGDDWVLLQCLRVTHLGFASRLSKQPSRRLQLGVSNGCFQCAGDKLDGAFGFNHAWHPTRSNKSFSQGTGGLSNLFI
jgi:hypothetical protein